MKEISMRPSRLKKTDGFLAAWIRDRCNRALCIFGLLEKGVDLNVIYRLGPLHISTLDRFTFDLLRREIDGLDGVDE